MTTTTRPQIVPSWTTGQPSQIAQPTPSLQASGFTAGQRPAYQTINFLLHNLSDWVQYLDAQANGQISGLQIGNTMRLLNGGIWSFSLSSNTLAWSEPFALSVPSIADGENTVAAGSIVIKPGQIAYVIADLPFATTGTTTSGSTSITQLPYELGIQVGQIVAGSGIPANTTVTSVTDGQVSISQAATATASNVYLTFTGTTTPVVKAADVASLMPSPNVIVIASATTNNVIVGVNSGQMRLSDNEQKRLLGTGYLHTTTAFAGQALTAGQFVYLASGGDIDTVMGTVTAGSPTISTGYAMPFILPGSAVSGIGLPANTTITAVNSTSLTLSAPAVTNSNNNTYTITRQSGGAYLADASASTGNIARSRAIGAVITTPVMSQTAPNSVHIMTAGSLALYNNLTTGAVYYVDPTKPGAITAVRPSSIHYTMVVGVALNATTLYVQPSAIAQLPSADSAFNDVSLAPITGANNPVQLRIADASNTTQALLDANGNASFRGNATAATLQSGSGTAIAPAQTFTADTTTGSFLSVVSSTAGALAWAVNKVQLLSLSASKLLSTVGVNAPTFVSTAGFKSVVDMQTIYAGPDVSGNPNAPTSYVQTQYSIVTANGVSNPFFTYSPTHNGSVVGVSVEMDTLPSGIQATIMIRVAYVGGVYQWIPFQSISNNRAAQQAKGVQPFALGNSITAFAVFNSANAVTRMRIQITIEMDA